MLSATNSPDSPCSPKILALCSDENIGKDRRHPSDRASSSSSEEDPADGPDDPPSLRFSIRDYVFTCRRKDVGNNWPFPQQYLQLCVKHGVGNLLPPFEPPDSVRARLSGVSEAAEDLVVPSGGGGGEEEARTGLLYPVKRGVESPTQVSVPGSPSSEHQNPSSEDKSIVFQALACKDDSSTLVCPVPAFQETGTVSESSSAVEAVKASSLAENTRSSSELPTKKCRLIVKFGGAPDPHRSEEKVGIFSSVLDTMASKVCPVCKTFSSSSNTTLNAHIDQCLSSEASDKMDAVWPSQHKVRPKKKRSMEEIYATAARFTLEDLDRKNGTSWALELTSMSQHDEASPFGETKHPRTSPLKRADNVSKSAVYVDSNGTKLLILSKFNDARPLGATDCSGAENCIKQLKNKVSPSGKKKIHPRYLKTKILTKKINSFSRMKGEVHKNTQHQMVIHQDKRIYRGSNATDHMEVDNPGPLGQWRCSKRSSLLKQLNGESSCRNLRSRLPMGNHVLPESNQSSLFCSFPAEKSIQRCHKSPDEMASTSKRVGTHVSPDTLASGNGEQCSADLHGKNARSNRKLPSISTESTMRCSRFTGKGICSTGSKNMEKCAHAGRISHKRQCLINASMDNHRLVHEGKMCSRRPLLTDVPQYEAETNKCNDVFQGLISKKPRKRRFVEKPHKAVKGLRQDAAEGFQGSHSLSGLNSTFNDVRSEMPQSSISKNIVRSGTKDTHDKILPHQHDMMDSNEAEPNCYPSDGEDGTLNDSHLGKECYHDETTTSDAQAKLPKIDLLVNHPFCKMLDASENEILNPKDHKVCTSDRLASSFPLEHQLESHCINEASNIPSAKELQGEKETNVGVIADGVPHRKIQQVTQTEVTGKHSCFSELQSIEYQADVSPIRSPSTCFSRPKDKIAELGNILSVNSCRTAADEMHSLMVDRELVGSPVSAASTISHLSKDAERGSSEEPVLSPEKVKPDSTKMGFLMDDSITWRMDMQETARNILEPEQFCDAQPCCSSLTNSIQSKSKILTQSSMSGMTVPINIKHVSSSLYVTSTGTCTHSLASARGTPILNPRSLSNSTKAPPDFVMNLPAFSDLRSSSPSSNVQFQNTSPVLRLMGKNLMVMNKEERSAQQLGQSVSTSVNTINDMFLPGFSSTCCSSNPYSICYQPLEGSTPLGQQTSGTQVPILSPAKQVDHHSGTPLRSLWMATSHGHCNWLDKQPCSSNFHNLEKACPINEGNIIVIDDSSNCKSRPSGSMQNQGNSVSRPPSFCYSSQNMYHWVDPGSSSKPTSPIQYPRKEICPTSWVSAVSSAHPLPRHFIAPSSSAHQLATTTYHSSHFQ